MNLYGPKQLAESMRTVRKNTIQIAEDIPEKDYNYRPTPESRSVLETLVHIASLSRFDRIVHEEQHLSSLEGVDFGALIKNGEAEEKRILAKSDVVALLLTQGDLWSQWLEGLSESILSEHVRQPGGALKTRFEMLVGTKEHEMHHRGQLMGNGEIAWHCAAPHSQPAVAASRDAMTHFAYSRNPRGAGFWICRPRERILSVKQWCQLREFNGKLPI